MATLTVKTRARIQGRDGFGRFARRADEAAKRTVERTMELGARSARSMAPAGKERWRYDSRPGYVPLKRSIKTEQRGTVGEWYSIAPHAPHVEFGTNAHLIGGKLKFTWAQGQDGWFVWNRGQWGHTAGLPTHHAEGNAPTYYTNADAGGAWVRHPGTGAQPFLRPSYERASARMMSIAREEYN